MEDKNNESRTLTIEWIEVYEQSFLGFLGRSQENVEKERGHNEGTIYQRSNGSWRTQIYINGNRISHGARTKADCQRWLRQMQFQLDHGYDYQGGKISFGEYLIQWLSGYQTTIRPKTYHRYKDLSDRYIVPGLGHIILKDLHPLTIEQLYANLISDGVGVRSVRLCHSVIHRALEKAIDYNLIIRNPSHNVTLPRYRPSEMKVWDDEQVSDFLVIAEGSPLNALYHLALTTGLRQGEIFGLKWSDLHWNKGTVQIQRQVQRVPGQGWSFLDPKTRKGRRKIKLGQGTLSALRLHIEKQREDIILVGDRWQDHDLIFPNSRGNPLDPSNLRSDFNRLIKKADLPKIRFHDLRHTAASLMLNNGVALIVVSRILGHAKPSITLDIYGHQYHEKQDEAAEIMDNLVTPIRVDLSAKENPRDELHHLAPEGSDPTSGALQSS